MSIRVPLTLETLWLRGLEGEQRARSCVDDVAAGLDTGRSRDDHQPSPLTRLVIIAEFLTGRGG
jgi:hypothetical protein